MRFPYTRIDPAFPARPYLNIFLRVGCATTDTMFGLVDSGADYPIFSAEFADILHLNLADGRPWSFRGTTGHLQIAYLHRVEMSVWDAENENLAFQFDTDVSFCPDFEFAAGSLLGQEGFLSHFNVSFLQRENYFDLTPINETIIVKRN